MPQNLNPGIQYDEQGRPFTYIGGTTQRSYISPVAMGTGQAPEDTTGIFHQAPQWNQHTGQWETPFDWGNLMTLGVGGALGAGALSAAGLFGGAGAGAAGGGLSEAAIPTMVGATPESLAGVGAGAAGALPSASWALPNAATTLPAGGTGLSAGGGGGALAGLLNGGQWVGPAIGAGAGLLGRLMGQGGNMQQVPPELQQLLAEATRRQMAQGPLFDAVTAQALAGLPNRGGR